MSLSSRNDTLSPRPGFAQLAAVSPPFPSRCITTGGNPGESAIHDPTMSASEVAPRIKFKRLDKTAKHIMQACVYLLVVIAIHNACSIPFVIYVKFGDFIRDRF